MSELLNLRMLSASGNRITDASHISNLYLLQHASLVGNPLNQPSHDLLARFSENGTTVAGLRVSDLRTVSINMSVVRFSAELNAGNELIAHPRHGLLLSWPTELGFVYDVEFSRNLIDWSIVPAANATGTGTPASVELADGGSGYYRLVLVGRQD